MMHLSAAAVLAQMIDVLLCIKSVVVSVVIFSLPQSPFRCLLSFVISISEVCPLALQALIK